MDPISPAVLAKIIGPAASKFATNWLGKLTHVRRVARASVKQTAAAGIPITIKSLRTWLSRADTAHQLQKCTEQSLQQAAEQLVFLISGNDMGQRRSD